MEGGEEEIEEGEVVVKVESPSPVLTFLDYLTPISLVLLTSFIKKLIANSYLSSSLLLAKFTI